MTNWEEELRRTVITDTLFIGTFTESRDQILRIVQDEIRKALRELWKFYECEEPDETAWLYLPASHFKDKLNEILEKRGINNLI